jgi:ubiquinone/menaquinone biosynthesis C-methylase UbiE
METAMIDAIPANKAPDLKSCCANLYESDLARLLLGDSFHPGGLALTERLGQLLNLQPGQRVLDAAAGQGTSAIFLAQRFGCEVVGVDFGADSVKIAAGRAAGAGLRDRISFEQGDVECLDFAPASFDAIICECAFCTFPDKTAAANGFARLLKPGGRVGLSDLTRAGPMPPELAGLLAWIACIADARPVAEYEAYLEEAGLTVGQVEPHNAALAELVRNIRTRLLGAELLVKLKKLDLPQGIDFEQAKSLAYHATAAVQQGKLGYVIVVGTK